MYVPGVHIYKSLNLIRNGLLSMGTVTTLCQLKVMQAPTLASVARWTEMVSSAAIS